MSAELRATAQRLRAARERLRARDPREIADALERVAALWLAPGSAWMARAVTSLAESGSFSRRMLEVGLPRMITPLGGGALRELVHRELGGWEPIERTGGPGLALHVLPSNLPGHAAIPSALSLLIRCAALLKPGRDDCGFSALWVESLSEVDTELGDCVHPVYWRGGFRAIEDEAMALVDLVVAAGSDAAVSELRRRCPVPIVGHGHRISFAMIGREMIGREMIARESVARDSAEALARDVAAWDQLGCLSPQVCFIEGDVERVRSFGEEVCDALAGLVRTMPPGRMSEGEVVEVRRFRDEASWRGFDDGSRDLFAVSGELGEGSVSVEREAALRPTPLHRCLRLVPISDCSELPAIVSGHRDRLEAAGIAVRGTRRAEISEMLSECGVHHVVPLGEMQHPDLAWRQGGRPRIAEWLDVARPASNEAPK